MVKQKFIKGLFVVQLQTHALDNSKKDLLMKEFDLATIDYSKYLNCEECRKNEFYCPRHKKEVESIINA